MAYKHLLFPKDSLFLVTGAAGFIGSNLCEAILNMGYRVRCLDDLSTGKQANVDLLAGNPNYEFIKGDIKNIDTCMKACEGVDYVMNEAAWGSVPRSIEMPLFYCANNIQGTLNMMEAARQKGVKTFVYASSSSVYGDEAHLPKQEGIEGNGEGGIPSLNCISSEDTVQGIAKACPQAGKKPCRTNPLPRQTPGYHNTSHKGQSQSRQLPDSKLLFK